MTFLAGPLNTRLHGIEWKNSLAQLWPFQIEKASLSFSFGLLATRQKARKTKLKSCPTNPRLVLSIWEEANGSFSSQPYDVCSKRSSGSQEKKLITLPKETGREREEVALFNWAGWLPVFFFFFQLSISSQRKSIFFSLPSSLTTISRMLNLSSQDEAIIFHTGQAQQG